MFIQSSVYIKQWCENERKKFFKIFLLLQLHLLQLTAKHRTTRSSRPEVFCKKGVLRNFAKVTGKHLCQSLFFNKVAGLRPQVFSCDFCEISKNTFCYRTPLVAASEQPMSLFWGLHIFWINTLNFLLLSKQNQ